LGSAVSVYWVVRHASPDGFLSDYSVAKMEKDEEVQVRDQLRLTLVTSSRRSCPQRSKTPDHTLTLEWRLPLSFKMM
jgi:hypothetical protein